MGTVLVLFTIGVLVVDRWLSPWFPFLLVSVSGLSLAGCKELVGLLGPERRPQVGLLYAGVVLLVSATWGAQVATQYGWSANAWDWIAGAFAGVGLASFLWEMANFGSVDHEASAQGGSIERMARTWWALGYLGLFPCFLSQVRWLYPTNQPAAGSVALALVIFVPKACDIGAYTAGRLLGRHPMTPVLSPKKTWEGAVGGLVLGAAVAVGINRWAGAPVLGDSLPGEIGFGLVLSGAGMLGDLAESLIKRDCRRKDASAAVPGFGGVLDVVDSVIFAAPVGYLWLRSLA
jgi:phosphatidate cytidylyltransferase